MADAYVGEIRLFGFNYPIQNWVPCDGRQMAIQNYQALYGAIGMAFGGDGRTYFNLPDLRGRVPAHAGTGTGLPAVAFAKPFGSPATTLSEAQVPLPTHTHAAVVGDPGHTHSAALPPHTHPVAVPCDSGAAGPQLPSPQGSYLSDTSDVLAGINTAINQANAASAGPPAPPLTSVNLYAKTTDSTLAAFDSGPASSTAAGTTGTATTGIVVKLSPAAAAASASVPLQPPSLGVNYMICVTGLFPVRC